MKTIEHFNLSSRLFCLFFLLLLLLPGLGTVLCALTGQSGNVSEGGRAVQLPSMKKEDGSLNTAFFSQAGDYFSRTFAGRDLLVSLYSALLEQGFSTSSDDGVIVGKEGWLFYTDSLADYQGIDLMTDRQVFDCAWSLCLLQDYLESQGSTFELAVAPNKAQLYGEYMPDRLGAGADPKKGNMLRLQEKLEELGVCYADLYGLLSGEDKVRYRKRDSHWDECGAMLASDAMLTKIGQPHKTHDTEQVKMAEGKQGDLDSMLYPLAMKTEQVPLPRTEPVFSYMGVTPETNFAYHIRTQGDGSGRLFMWRDSFGSAVLPYLSEAFEKAYFTRGTPRIASQAVEEQADVVIFEIAQRMLRTLPQMPPWIPAPLAPQAFSLEFKETLDGPTQPAESVDRVDENSSTEKAGQTGMKSESAALEMWEENGFFLVRGILADRPQADDRIFLQTEEGVIYEAMPFSDEDGREGFFACFPADRAEKLQREQWKVAVGKPEISYEEMMSLIEGYDDTEAQG